MFFNDDHSLSQTNRDNSTALIPRIKSYPQILVTCWCLNCRFMFKDNTVTLKYVNWVDESLSLLPAAFKSLKCAHDIESPNKNRFGNFSDCCWWRICGNGATLNSAQLYGEFKGSRWCVHVTAGADLTFKFLHTRSKHVSEVCNSLAIKPLLLNSTL